ncbi:hypothetical protein B5E56_12370 [Flavonifractor sp. An112]|uniref:DUF4358 domain-containing protein n=1 Tax=Flavonifractor sp. An112 TaxID=1965544 RepID=UPI000B399A04|nr:DUF4358 domain-containing protein [Flavonifractor sp. An112]OUQ56870.1 hypothetical protein B5E56_12370 [Flavonifractor sp. An112]
MKKFGAAALALTLAGSMTLPALAVETPVLISAKVGYSTAITLNGEKLDTAALPAASDSMLPLRLVAESDHGNVYWDQEGNEAWFNFGQDRITVQFADNTILVNDEQVKGQAEVTAGVTYVPASVLAMLDGYTVTWADPTAVDITTPNNDPMVKLAYSIMESSEMFGSRTYEDMLADAYKIPVDEFEQIVAFFPMITSPDTVIIGKLADGADEKAVTDALEAYRKSQEDTFSWYLSQHLPKVQDARTVIEDGYVFFFIGENADQAEQLFHDFVAAQG